MLLDILFGIIIVMSVAVTLVTMIRREGAAESTLADSRRALHLAEHALLNLQHAQPMPTVAAGAVLKIHSATGGIAPAGFVWAKVDAAVNGHSQSLLGVVPAASLRAAGAKS